uniref:Proteasome assembly chaperone 4 n=1 Tax=Graphocephala atropunctata TaxID=36148 RepID=A0A1B6KZT8_9HEMI
MEASSREKETAQIESTDSRLSTHSFSENIGSTVVMFSVLKLKDSAFMWIGSGQEPRLVNMCVAMKTPYESLPLTTQVLGSRSDEMSPGLASQLAKRLSKPVFVSVNIELDRCLFPEVTKRLNEEIKKYPECF